MRSVSIQELAEDTEGFIAEVEAGHKLVLMRGNKAVAEIGPAPAVDQTPQLWKTEKERLANGAEFPKLLRRGYDLGGFKITNRDDCTNVTSSFTHDTNILIYAIDASDPKKQQQTDCLVERLIDCRGSWRFRGRTSSTSPLLKRGFSVLISRDAS